MRDERSALAKVTDLLSGAAGRVIIIALLLLLTFEGLRFCFSFGHAIFYQQPAEAAPGTDHVVSLDEDMSMSGVADLLSEEGLIRNKLAFVIQGELYQTRLYPGDYTLNTSMTTKEILTALNTEPEEYEAQLKEAQAEAQETDDDVIGGGADVVDEDQAKAAAGEGIAVTPDAGAPAESVQADSAQNAGETAGAGGGAQ